MDWSRAKTILIVSFLCLNLFLGYQLWENQKQQSIQGQVSQIQMEELVKRLKDADIAITDESVSEELPEMSNMRVVIKNLSESYNHQRVAETHWEHSQLEVLFEEAIPLPDVEAERNALIASEVELFDQYELEPSSSTDDVLLYEQQINGYPVFTSQLLVELSEQGWSRYKQTYYIPEDQGASRQVVSAYTTLAVLLDNGLLSAGEEVQQIRLGYVVEQLDTDVQFLVPAWQVMHTNGIHYVNGFTGMVIGATKNK